MEVLDKEIIDTNFKEACESILTLLKICPDSRLDLEELISAFILKEISSKQFDAGIRDLCLDIIKECAHKIKKSLKADRRVLNAYYDVARYQTDLVDACIEWECDRDILTILLQHRKPTALPNERLKLPVPQAVVDLREIN